MEHARLPADSTPALPSPRLINEIFIARRTKRAMDAPMERTISLEGKHTTRQFSFLPRSRAAVIFLEGGRGWFSAGTMPKTKRCSTLTVPTGFFSLSGSREGKNFRASESKFLVAPTSILLRFYFPTDYARYSVENIYKYSSFPLTFRESFSISRK